MRIPAPWRLLLRADDLHAGRRREAEKIRGDRTALEIREIEFGAIALAVRIFEALDEMRGGIERERDAANRARRVFRLQRDRVAGLFDDEQPLARRRIAD